VIGLLVGLLAVAGSAPPPPQKPRVPTAREDTVVTALDLLSSDFRGSLVPYYFPAAGFTGRVGMEWSFQ